MMYPAGLVRKKTIPAPRYPLRSPYVERKRSGIVAFLRSLLTVNSDRKNATIPDRLRSTYGERSGYLGAGIVFFLTSPAGYIMTLGTLYQWFFGINTTLGMIIAVATPLPYLL